MKKTSATIYSPALELPAITRKYTRRLNKRRISEEPVKLANKVSPPSEEVIQQLNRIAQEYPFCVYYRQKVNDPL
ncbi:hypothetical protein [Longitalea luteola]|uniref:hypothetical protein n=1 Tax=Longitalea luteola TaxID=2812563 RepID=UPI001A95D926|nr:hypothetical protein [Longitalea luteola]